MANYGITYEKQNQESRLEAQKKLEELKKRCKSMICITEIVHEYGRVTVVEKWCKPENLEENG